jgi:hypothetical protein
MTSTANPVAIQATYLRGCWKASPHLIAAVISVVVGCDAASQPDVLLARVCFRSHCHSLIAAMLTVGPVADGELIIAGPHRLCCLSRLTPHSIACRSR